MTARLTELNQWKERLSSTTGYFPAPGELAGGTQVKVETDCEVPKLVWPQAALASLVAVAAAARRYRCLSRRVSAVTHLAPPDREEPIG
jgi:hypothetical protein